jgi:catechol 2,3-dioxygenase-like lactoylglutathione lyase family enzyme
MFSHIFVGTNDLERSKKFYDAVLGVLGAPPAQVAGHRMFYRVNGGTLGVGVPIDGDPATFANGGTIGFACASPEQTDAWHAAGVANGGAAIEDPPGPRGTGPGSLYLAYLRDPDGNKLCGLYRMA